ncbi:MAG: hypothetical protein WCC97_01910 [Candidatus Acidiferrales bacterium]
MFMLFAALLPAARAQIVPVSLTKTSVADSRIPTGAVLTPLPRSEPRRAIKTALPRSFFVLSAGVYAAAGLDMQRSEAMLPDFDERDPIARPFLRLPTPAYYASAALFATGMNFLGWKMARSARWHKIWWVPQLTSMAGNLAGYGYTRVHPSPRWWIASFRGSDGT